MWRSTANHDSRFGTFWRTAILTGKAKLKIREDATIKAMKKENKLRAELERLQGGIEHLVEEHKQLTEKFVILLSQLDKLQRAKKLPPPGVWLIAPAI